MKFFVAIAVLFLAGPAYAQVSVVSQRPYAPQGVEELVLKSKSLARDFVIVVSPPANPIVPGMAPPPAGQKLPAVYALDGGYGVAAPIAQMLAISGVAAPAYVVSISYPPNAGRRDTDLLFHPVTEGASTYGGGGAAFMDFLTTELRPFLEARYPLDPGRAVLFGHSFGGLFAANVLAQNPGAFSGYIIASASVWRDPDLPARLRAAGSGEQRVFVAAGGNEDARMLAATDGIADAVSAPGSRLKVRRQIFEGDNHLSYYPKLAQAGLSWTIPSNAAGRVPTSVSAEEMDRVTGVYQLADGRRATIERRGQKLYAQMTGIPGEIELLAENPRRFFVAGGFDVVLFFDGQNGQRAGRLTLSVSGQDLDAERAAP